MKYRIATFDPKTLLAEMEESMNPKLTDDRWPIVECGGVFYIGEVVCLGERIHVTTASSMFGAKATVTSIKTAINGCVKSHNIQWC